MDDRTVASLKAILSWMFFASLIGLAVVGLILNRPANIGLNRRWSPFLSALIGVLLVFFAATSIVLETRRWSSLGVLVIIVPFVTLALYRGFISTAVCDKCGFLQHNAGGFARPRYCPMCGAELNGKPSPDDRLLD